MIVLAITLTAWAILRKCTPKREKKPVYAVSATSAADITRNSKARERDAKEAERQRKISDREAEKQRKALAEKQQAEADSTFYIDQIDKLYEMLWEVEAELNKARATCERDNETNAHGAIIAEKVVNKHRADRDKLAKKVMQLENSIHAKETKLCKAQYIVKAGA